MDYRSGMSSTGLADVFVRRRAAAGRAWTDDRGELEAILAAHAAAARAAWPGLALSDEQFVEHLADRLPEDAGVEALGVARAADLYVARAVAGGDARAIAGFEAKYFGEVDAGAVRLRAAPDVADEVKQVLRRGLFVATGERPAAVAEFAGRGDLRGWIRVTAVRELQRLLKQRNREVHVTDETFLDLLSPMNDPELSYLRERYQRQLAEAVGASIAAATARERALLRYHVLDGLNIEEIGRIYGVHRATVARWIAAARESILERTRAELQDRFGIAAAEVASIVRMVQSRLDISMERVLS
jgi:RNA polymerase sigma-70 factor (ECF subfamily)